MFIFALFILISIVMYIYYKVAILKTKDKLSQKYINAKSRIFLGTFLIFFGINQYIAYQTRFVLFISIVFLARSEERRVGRECGFPSLPDDESIISIR